MKVIVKIMASGIGSKLPRNNRYPILGKPMLDHFLTEVKKNTFIDEIFVWTEDEKLSSIANNYNCHVIPRGKEIIVDHDNFAYLLEFNNEIQDHIKDKCGTVGDIVVYLDCNFCLLTADIIERMFVLLMEDRTADTVVPVTEIDPHLHMINHKTGDLFPVWEHQSLDRQDYPNLFRTGGIRIDHLKRRASSIGQRVLHYVVDQEFLLNVNNLDNVELAEYYLIRRIGGKILVDEDYIN